MRKTRDQSRGTCMAFVACCFIIMSAVLCTDAHFMWQQQQQQPTTNNGTSHNISEIFIGRCVEHLQCLQSDQCFSPETADCESLWQAFLAIFQYKLPCNTPVDAYDDVIAMAPPTTPPDQPNQTLFWSGLLDSAHNVARVSKHYRILEETLPGFIANRLTWCGDPDSVDGMNHTMCPKYGTDSYCEGDSSYIFWMAASREFAKHAEGMASVALNVSREGGAFNEKSTFATTELPNLDPKKIDLIEILLIPDLTKPKNESEVCDSGTILVLQERIEKLGMKWKCTTDPPLFRYIHCATLDDPLDYAACNSGETGFTYEWKIILGAIGCGVLLLIIVLVIVIVILAKRLASSSIQYTQQG